jgi:hypothetical protein
MELIFSLARITSYNLLIKGGIHMLIYLIMINWFVWYFLQQLDILELELAFRLNWPLE